MTDEIAALVEPARVHRRVYTDPDVFKVEMERVWGKAWIFIGHESMVPAPGDFITTTLGLHPVIMVRDTVSDTINVLHNRCGHRGVKLTEKAHGNATVFRCFYHGWTYRTDGGLGSVPSVKGYKETEFDLKAACYQMRQIPRVAMYRGFVFASLAETGPDLEEFLGETRHTIDNLADRSPEGRIEVVGKVCNRFHHPCNWKNFIENGNDAMHPMVAHAATGKATAAYAKKLGPDTPPPVESEVLYPFGGSYKFFDDMGQTGLPYGHNYMGGHNSIFSHFNLPEDYVASLEKAYGRERAHKILGHNRHNTTIYPSVVVRDAVQSIRVVRPVSVDECVVETWVFRLVGAQEELFERTLLYSRLINSPGSMVGPDDLDCYRRMQLGLESDLSEWVDFNRYLNDDESADGKFTAIGTSDMVFRNQYDAWLNYMLGDQGA